LDANESYDPDGSIAAYEWREGQTLLGIEMTLMQQFGAGLHTITLTVTDNEDANATDTVDINVRFAPGQFFAKKLWPGSVPAYHSCAVLNDNSVKCWGNNIFGSLGDGTTTTRLTPVSVSGISNATAVGLGRGHSCALLSDGSIKCWGANPDGRLGDGTSTHRYTPVSVSGISNATAIAVGSDHSCALLSDGSIKCWGYNGYGQLGNGTTTNSSTPVSVSGISNAIAIAVGGNHSCAIVIDEYGNRIYCWGRGSDGQLGNHSFSHRSTPVTISQYEITTAVAISLGGNHSCAMISDGRAKCWGDNRFGQLGLGTSFDGSTPDRYSPITVWELAYDVVDIGLGENHSCAVLNDNSVKCWGWNSYGRLGDGTTTDRNIPVSVLGISNATAVSSGWIHSCALLSDNSVKCWGSNANGQLGDGTTTDRFTPVNVIS